MGRRLWGQAEFTGAGGAGLRDSVWTRSEQLQPRCSRGGVQAPASLQQPASLRKRSCGKGPGPRMQGDLGGRRGWAGEAWAPGDTCLLAPRTCRAEPGPGRALGQPERRPEPVPGQPDRRPPSSTWGRCPLCQSRLSCHRPTPGHRLPRPGLQGPWTGTGRSPPAAREWRRARGPAQGRPCPGVCSGLPVPDSQGDVRCEKVVLRA